MLKRDTKKDSNPAKHIRQFADRRFTGKILMSAPSNFRLRKTIEAYFIALKGPSINEQEDNELFLFKNGVT